MKRIAIALGAVVALMMLLITYSICTDTGPSSGPCEWQDYLHRQSTVYICDNEPRWGRWP